MCDAVTVWARTEGTDGPIPIICADCPDALVLAYELARARIVIDAEPLPCCHTTGYACIRDTFTDETGADEYAQPINIIRATAAARFIDWPTDLARFHDA